MQMDLSNEQSWCQTRKRPVDHALQSGNWEEQYFCDNVRYKASLKLAMISFAKCDKMDLIEERWINDKVKRKIVY